MGDDQATCWARLGFRFDGARQHTGTSGLFTCRAHDLLLDRAVSLRVVTQLATPAELDSFDREAEALQLIGAHPAIVGLTEIVQHDDLRMLVLDDVVAGMRGPIDARAAVHVIITLAGAVETAHRIGVLHGRIEPAAVLTRAHGSPALAGFTCRLRDPQPPVLHEASPHTAPEVLLGEPLDESVDVYGLASTLYELITGTPAIRSYPGESPAALSLRVLTGATVRLEQAGVPFELADVIGWAMSVDRADRPPSAAWLAEELGRVQRGQGWPHTRLHIGSHPEPVLSQRRATRHRP